MAPPSSPWRSSTSTASSMSTTIMAMRSGDALLAKIAQRLSASLRPSDMLARLSGDEFVLLMSPIADREELERDVDWICEAEGAVLSTAMRSSPPPRSASAFIRMTAATYEELRANADRAMYDGKGRAKGTVRFFDGSIRHAADEKSRLEQRLRLAIRDKRVCCAYQPKVAPAFRRVGRHRGADALARRGRPHPAARRFHQPRDRARADRSSSRISSWPRPSPRSTGSMRPLVRRPRSASMSRLAKLATTVSCARSSTRSPRPVLPTASCWSSPRKRSCREANSRTASCR